MAKNRILCISEDYQLNEVDLTVDDQGIFTIEDQLPVVPVFLPSSPAMLSRGIAGSPDGNKKTLFVLERYVLSSRQFFIRNFFLTICIEITNELLETNHVF